MGKFAVGTKWSAKSFPKDAKRDGEERKAKVGKVDFG